MASGLSGSLVTRVYGDFKGVDFGNDPGIVNLSRSPDALNVWKNYETDEGNCIQTRPGYVLAGNFMAKINGMYVIRETLALIHSGTKLYKVTDFPTMESRTEIATMNNQRSYMYMIDRNVYINDGEHYYKYDVEESSIINVYEEAYVPTTTISRSPSGGGKIYEGVNLLTDKRINTFCADGTSTSYHLDAQYIRGVESVYVNGVLMVENTLTEIHDYYINLERGTVEFTVAPPAPSTIGKDNVVITFTKTIMGYRDRIPNCRIAVPFDNRIFFAGNPDYPNALFHSSLNNPAYISDLDYYEDGTDSIIRSLVVGNNVIYALKGDSQNRDTIFYHTPTTDSTYGRIYPRSQGNISEGCYVSGYNYRDSIVFLSRNGLEAINGDIESLQVLHHKSSNVDNKLVNASNYSNACICEWAGYLVIAVDDRIFLADSRQTFVNNSSIEYEWYYWKISENISYLHNYNNVLYFGTENGSIFYFGGGNDNGDAIESYWTTPMDQFKYPQYRKTTNKRGTIAKIKNVQNGKINIYARTDRKNWKLLKTIASAGFDFNNIDFDNFSFSSGDNFYLVFRIKQKKIKHVQFKFECSELNKRFGIYQLNTSAYLGSFVK